MRKLITILLIIWVFPSGILFSQEVPQTVANKAIYEFLDELATLHIININSAVKPYSRLFIANALKEASKKTEQLSARQQHELNFYLLDFGKELDNDWRNGFTVFKRKSDQRRDLLYYKDSVFSFTINPILGGEVFSNSAGTATYSRNGAEARGYIKKWGFYASLRDNHETPLLGLPEYLTQRVNGHIKGTNDWSEARGGITYAWKWGSAGLVKDIQQWGNNYNGANIFGGNNPSFVQLTLHLSPVKWFDFHYFHGWLNSMVVDSARSFWVTNSYGTDYREMYHNKFIAANMFTFTPLKNLNISAGNSIVYDYDNVHPVYLIPFLFYKSVDHSITSGINNMNSQMFFDISSRLIKNLHMYGTMFIDEMSVSRFSMDDQWNFFSYTAGFRLTDLPFSNISFTTEFTYTYPLTFQHNVPTTTFQNTGYNLGHYMKDNSKEWYLAIDYKPARTLNINIYYLDALRGPDYTEAGVDRVGNPPFESIEWHNTSYGIRASYQVVNDLFTWISFSSGNISGDSRWSPEYFYGRKNTLNMGLSLGF